MKNIICFVFALCAANLAFADLEKVPGVPTNVTAVAIGPTQISFHTRTNLRNFLFSE